MKPKNLKCVPQVAPRRGNVQHQMFKSSIAIFSMKLSKSGHPDINRKGCKALVEIYRTIHKCSKGDRNTVNKL